jgi:uncharacterized damage-inducible protein DinB
MAVSADTLRTHLAYTTWASRRLVDAAARLTPEELTRDFQTADRSVLRSLAHVFAADRIWLARLTQAPTPQFITEEDYSLSVLQNDWPALLDRWQQWAADLTDESAQAIVAYKDMKGNPYSQPLWQLVLHVVNHGTHHRGQVSGFLRVMGHSPPPLDLVFYYREQAAAASG